MRARMPKFAAALCATVALVTAPIAAVVGTSGLAPVVTASAATVTVPGHWYDAPAS